MELHPIQSSWRVDVTYLSWLPIVNKGNIRVYTLQISADDYHLKVEFPLQTYLYFKKSQILNIPNNISRVKII